MIEDLMSFLGACVALLVASGLWLLGGLFFARALVSICPGGLLLNLRRLLFLWTQPFLEPISGWFSIRLLGVDGTALAVAAVCFLVAKGIVPWAAWAGFRLSAG
jgi:uncharacterized protein YggT (Ycf19 family)